MSYSLKQNDRLPNYEVRLEAGGQPIDLTDCYVNFIMRPLRDPTPKVSARAVVDDAAGGLVHYEWALGDTDTTGTFRVEWEIVYPGFLPRRVPSDGYAYIKIEA